MHLAESFALAAGSKLNNQRIYEKYTPLDCDKFISFHKIYYEQYQEVINLLNPILKASNIEILQIGGHNYANVKNVSKVKDYNNLAYILRNSLLHFGEYSILFDICSSVKTKSVILNSVAYENILKPYFFDKENGIIINNYAKNDDLPMFDANKSKHLLNEIKPEYIASKILNLLFNIEFKSPYETIHRGEYYKENFFETNVYPIADYVYNLDNIGNPVIRMDFNYNLSFLENQLKKNKCRIRSHKELPIEFIEKYKEQISGIDLEIKGKENFTNFISKAKRMKIDLLLFSFSDEQKANDLKLMYIDSEAINFQKLPSIKIDFDLNDPKLFFKCDEVILYRDKFYISEKDIINNNYYDPNKFNPLSKFDLSENLANSLIVRT